MLTQLQYDLTFLAVVNHGSFAAAAPHLWLASRNGVRYRIEQLQIHTGRQLFHCLNGRGPARLTEDGVRYLEEVRERVIR